MEDDYEYALRHRKNWWGDDGVGEVTYVGNYCVITGHVGDSDAPYGWGLPTVSPYISIMYSVGNGSLMESGAHPVGQYHSWTVDEACCHHEALVDQASKMDLLELVYGE